MCGRDPLSISFRLLFEKSNNGSRNSAKMLLQESESGVVVAWSESTVMEM